MESRNTVSWWVKARIHRLVEEKIGSATQVEQDDFKTIVKHFVREIETVHKDLDEQIKDKRANAVKMFEVTRL